MSNEVVTRRNFLNTTVRGATAAVVASQLEKLPFVGEAFRMGRAEAAPHLDYGLDWDLRPPISGLSPLIPEGHFYTQTGVPGQKGFIIFNDEAAPMWNIFQQYGGMDVWGPPVSDRFIDEEGRIVQMTQRGGFQFNPKTREIQWMNIFDNLADRKISVDAEPNWIPDPANWDSDRPLSWGHTQEGPLPGTKEENHIKQIFSKAAVPTATDEQIQLLKDKYLSNPIWFDMYGLPMAIKDYGRLVVVRCQRAGIQLWKDPTPWTENQPNGVVVLLGGVVAKEKGLVAKEAGEAKYNPFGVGGPVSVESLLAVSKEVDRAETTLNGQKFAIESKVSPIATKQVKFEEATKQALVNVIAKDGVKNGFKTATLIVLNTTDEGPDGLPFGGTAINLGYYKGTGKADYVGIGYFSSQKVGDRVILYFAPAPNLNLNDADIVRGVNDALAYDFLATAISGGNKNSFNALNGKADHTDLVNQQALRFSGIPKN